ncbi:3-hydroxyisobutyrate dehydrogenase [Micromonospora sonchi]|uniref:3-hydroxyisobutyrate dehydrogenase n=2 Tax=Micromonospora sonchi TaxID=1763543 RepID=A0A917TYF1_9ACTN|nr:3-hydroxyisobutyrate dehydrogenase [Micromonospora sonchi]
MTGRPVTVLGLGRMGSALAGALLDAGSRTVVWNRTADKAEALAARAAVPAGSAAEAIQASPLVIVCLLDYDNVRAVLEPNADVLADRTLVNLTTGTPEQASALADWAGTHGAHYLDGAMMAVPQTVGTPEAFFLYSGSSEAFDAHRPTLDHLAASHYLGSDPSVAELWDSALLGSGYAALTGFLHSVALLDTAGVAPTRFLPLATQWLNGMLAFMPDLAQEIEAGDYSKGVSPVDMNRAAVHNISQISTRHGVDADVHAPLLALLDRRIADGHPADSFASIVEVLRERRD